MKVDSKILMTGASGFVGANVLAYFLDTEPTWEITCLCSWSHKGSPLRLQRLMNINNKNLKIITHDITTPIPEDLGEFDYVLNLASESHVDRSITDPYGVSHNNIELILQMLEYARKIKPKKFIHFSTDEVYGPHHHKNWDLLLPSNPYAASKAAQELICYSYWRTYNVPLIITNSNNIIGPFQHNEKFIPKILDKAKTKEPITIHAVNGLIGNRVWNPVGNVASALAYIVNNVVVNLYDGNDLIKPPRIALTGGEEMSNLEIAQRLYKLLNVDLSYNILEASSIRPGYDKFYGECLDDATLMNNWKPSFNVNDTLAEIISLSEWLK
jgi:dTDP-glucose 4,6-dehydratase